MHGYNVDAESGRFNRERRNGDSIYLIFYSFLFGNMPQKKQQESFFVYDARILCYKNWEMLLHTSWEISC